MIPFCRVCLVGFPQVGGSGRQPAVRINFLQLPSTSYRGRCDDPLPDFDAVGLQKVHDRHEIVLVSLILYPTILAGARNQTVNFRRLCQFLGQDETPQSEKFTNKTDQADISHWSHWLFRSRPDQHAI